MNITVTMITWTRPIIIYKAKQQNHNTHCLLSIQATHHERPLCNLISNSRDIIVMKINIAYKNKWHCCEADVWSRLMTMLHVWKVNDFFKLDRALQSAKSVAVIGGGFLGSELACCLSGKRGLSHTSTKTHSHLQLTAVICTYWCLCCICICHLLIMQCMV